MEPGNEGTTHIDQFTDSLIPVRACLHFILKHESFLKFCNMLVSGTSPSWYTFISVNRDSFLLRLQGSSRRTGYWQ